MSIPRYLEISTSLDPLIFRGKKRRRAWLMVTSGAAAVTWSYPAIEMKMVKKVSDPSKSRADGRKALLLYMTPSIIRELKLASLDDGRHAYELAEEAIQQWLQARTKGAAKRKG
jgi:hypothetical protein